MGKQISMTEQKGKILLTIYGNKTTKQKYYYFSKSKFIEQNNGSLRE